ncbi:hypothetical protein C7271_04730, partial [filamentous cyanobacterium CCP5]
MLVLKPIDGVYPDDLDSALKYHLPTGLVPLPGADGVPQAVIARSPEGGLMHLKLKSIWPDMGPNDRRILFAEGRFRLQLKIPGASESGRWQTFSVGRETLAECNLAFNPTEAAIARHLGSQGENLVDVEVELTYRGYSPTYPWRISADAATLQSLLVELLADMPASWAAIQTAFWELPANLFTWQPLEAGALPPP